jgi:predicted ester cyclase
VKGAIHPDPLTVIGLYVEAINRNDWESLRRLLHPDFRRYSTAAGASGEENVAAFLQFLQDEHKTYPDAREEVLDLFSNGQKVGARHLFTGTQLGPLGRHAPTGKKVRSVYIALYQVENGQITGAWAEWDNLADLRQLGLAPGVA